ncbi:23S rRNA pseudouridine(2605) synthase RluB [unidentified bacterial endosymbiont]|uniref:23S rRNA pseudouridine(2605) synthase RluB n=1 Tax=unidentified bacterial endosymbiont TaxID=2355 RepID=UPI0020A1D9F0|nr:23S rRNA pseudouridine(2605) synthase RluB [unidentified bacterial endosymbiont]
MQEKLHKVLARAGHGSRRQLERWIAEGRISINGCVAKTGERIDARQPPLLTLDQRPLILSHQPLTPCRVLCYYKPEGELCTRQDPQDRPTIFSRLPRLSTGRWITIGRLDLNSSGLLLLTNDGELANRLMHPRYQVQREYAVRVFGTVTAEQLQRLRQGVRLEDGIARFDTLIPQGGQGSNQWFKVILREGRTREIRRLWQSQGVQVSRLIRIRYADVDLPKQLSRGCCQELPAVELDRLRRQVGLLPVQEEPTISHLVTHSKKTKIHQRSRRRPRGH